MSAPGISFCGSAAEKRGAVAAEIGTRAVRDMSRSRGEKLERREDTSGR